MRTKLRWYQTYDRHGVNSTETLQFQIIDDDGDIVDGWQDVDFVRERFIEVTAQYDEED